MLYAFLKVVVGFGLKIFFRNIYIQGVENINIDRPQIIASNHPNGFLEPLIMACYLPRPLYFLVRGDVFENKILRYFLKATNQIPIYRFKDGFSKLRDNSQTIDESTKILNENKCILIFAEGGTESVKKLRPLKKGLSRIAFQSMEQKQNSILEIVPTSINFTYPTKFNEDVIISFGKPINVKPHFDNALDNKNTASEELLSVCYNEMKKNIIHLESKETTDIYEVLAPYKRSHMNDSFGLSIKNAHKYLSQEQALIEDINTLSKEEILTLHKTVKTLEKSISKEKIKVSDLRKVSADLWVYVVLFISIIPALIGLLSFGSQILLSRFLVRKLVTSKEFKSSLTFVFFTLFSLITFATLLLLVVFGVLPWWIPIIVIASGLWLKYFYFLYEKYTLFGYKKISNFKNKIQNILLQIQKNTNV